MTLNWHTLSTFIEYDGMRIYTLMSVRKVCKLWLDITEKLGAYTAFCNYHNRMIEMRTMELFNLFGWLTPEILMPYNTNGCDWEYIEHKSQKFAVTKSKKPKVQRRKQKKQRDARNKRMYKFESKKYKKNHR